MRTNSNVIAAISYLTWIGFIVALLIRDRGDDFTAMHMNQALVLNIISIIGGILAAVPLIGGIASGIIGLVTFVLACMGIYRAATWSNEPLPIVGDIHLMA
jgi:uncharacterized membrane protein